MTDKEVNIRSVLFLVIGILLVLSLVICIYIVNTEKDLVSTDAVVVDVKNDKDGTGKNDVTVMYEVDNVTYEYNFYYKDDIKKDDKVTVFYDEENVKSVKPYKTSKLIFVCPILGLILCVLGLFELFSKSKDKVIIDGVDTKVIGEDAKTQQLKIITSDENVVDYVKTPEEEEEVPIKEIREKVDISIDVEENSEKIFDKTGEFDKNVIDEALVEKNEEVSFEEVNKNNDLLSVMEEKVNSNKEKDEVKEEIMVENPGIEITEKKEEQKTPEIVKEKVSPIKVIPKDYYISGGNLVYEVTGKEFQELELKDIIRVVKTINSEGKIVKITLYFDEVICVLINMKNIDLEKMANTIHNKMIVIDSVFQEEIEYKEY